MLVCTSREGRESAECMGSWLDLLVRFHHRYNDLRIGRKNVGVNVSFSSSCQVL